MSRCTGRPRSAAAAATADGGRLTYTGGQTNGSVAGMTGARTLDEMHRLARAAARARGDALFPALAQYVAKALNATESLISQAVDAQRVRTLAVFAHGASEPNYEYELAGTPCAAVLQGDTVHHESGLAEK